MTDLTGIDADAAKTLLIPAHLRACLFDLDGVLTQTAKLHALAWKQMFDAYLQETGRRRGEPFVPFDADLDYARYVDGKLRLDGAQSFLTARGLRPPPEVLGQLAASKDDALLELLRERTVETYEGSVRFVVAARRAGRHTAVVSASQHCEEVLRSAGIAGLFDERVDGLVAARAHLAGKPAPDTFLFAARALGVAAGEAAVFEDALAGVEAGRTGRFGYVVGVDRRDQAAALKAHGADVVVTDLADLLG
jgi:HAD superfamily hydrolase (TIGR01509 family)